VQHKKRRVDHFPMSLPAETLKLLQYKALQIRIDSIRATTEAKSGHPTSCLSIADVVSTLFFYQMRYDPHNPAHPNNDRLILSKGHAVPVIYAAWKNVGILTDQQLLSLRKFSSELEGHPTPRWKYNEAATGSLGQGLSIGVGEALNAQRSKLSYRTYVIMGDGEVAEGSIWEATELAAFYNLDNLVGIVDVNRLGQSGIALHQHDVERYRQKWTAFGWHAIVVNGHDIPEVVNAFREAENTKGKPTIIIAKTFKGYGLSNIADKIGYHGKPFTEKDAVAAIEELNTKWADIAKFIPPSNWLPKRPEHVEVDLSKPKIVIDLEKDINSSAFDKGKKLAVRKAFGFALAAVGRASSKVWALDADVKNSTFLEFFEKEHPERFVQCFIAEQNMVGISIGLDLRGKIPFCSTFGCFFTRAFDQLRMAGIGRNALRLCGTHCGVSIGADGPSQMGLEDIAMIRSIPNSVVFYPSDGVSTFKIAELMANYNDGISYLRATRADTENIYDKNEKFEIGGLKVLRQSDNDQLVIVAAGITLHEALAAYEELKKNGIHVAIVDLYCVKPLNARELLAVARKAKNRIVTVEDHYFAGGIGEAVCSALINEGVHVEVLCVRELSRSGEERELLEFAKIDRKAIVTEAKKMTSQ